MDIGNWKLDIIMPKHYNIRILGIVQGVSFRWWVYNAANEFNIAGFVKNEDDGSVLIEAEGKEDDLEKFMDRIKAGPPAARITEFKREEGKIKKYKNFQII